MVDQSKPTRPMIEQPLLTLFDAIAVPRPSPVGNPVFAVRSVPQMESYLIGKDSEGHACLLVTIENGIEEYRAPIRLNNLQVQFETRCRVKDQTDADFEAVFTVIRCQSTERETVCYFLSVCEMLLRVIGEAPTQQDIESAVYHLANIFRKIQDPATKSVNGFFGEVYFISRCTNPVRAMQTWRVNETARFDFVDGNIRLDVKTSAGRVRIHTFSYDQCNPPDNTIAIVASIFVERIARGLSLRMLLERVEEMLLPNQELVFKLHEVFAATLGSALHEALDCTFDEELATSSLRYFDMRQVPAIRGILPDNVTDVHFRSDLSETRELDIESVSQNEPGVLEYTSL